MLQSEQLTSLLCQSTPGEKEQYLISDGNDGHPLPAAALFGEVVAGSPIVPPAAKARPAVPVAALETETLA